jgi:hypothetical protein
MAFFGFAGSSGAQSRQKKPALGGAERNIPETLTVAWFYAPTFAPVINNHAI